MYLIAAGQLLFARRDYRWQAFPLALITGAGWFGTTKGRISPRVKRAILTSILDASAAHHGACLGIIVNDKRYAVTEALLDQADEWSDGGNLRRRLFGVSDFTALSRRRRLKLLSMDGATLVDQSGRIVAGGAILKVPGGSPGGGRTAAARAIGRYGIGIKVSQDGPITAYDVENGDFVVQFSMG